MTAAQQLLSSWFSRAASAPQTKAALFTILGDLRAGDHFNFISFSSRVKVWQPGRLVPVTPANVREAKKFIFMLPTSGGETPATPPAPAANSCDPVEFYFGFVAA